MELFDSISEKKSTIDREKPAMNTWVVLIVAEMRSLSHVIERNTLYEMVRVSFSLFLSPYFITPSV